MTLTSLDTVRDWRRANEQGGVAELRSFGRQWPRALSEWVDANCPPNIGKVGSFLRWAFGVILFADRHMPPSGRSN